MDDCDGASGCVVGLGDAVGVAVCDDTCDDDAESKGVDDCEGRGKGVGVDEALKSIDGCGPPPPGATMRILPVGDKAAVLGTHSPVVGAFKNCPTTKPEQP